MRISISYDYEGRYLVATALRRRRDWVLLSTPEVLGHPEEEETCFSEEVLFSAMKASSVSFI